MVNLAYVESLKVTTVFGSPMGPHNAADYGMAVVATHRGKTEKSTVVLFPCKLVAGDPSMEDATLKANDAMERITNQLKDPDVLVVDIS